MDREYEPGGADVAPPDAWSLEARIRALPELPVGALRAAWTAAWDAPPPKGARRRMLGIAWKWQEFGDVRAEGFRGRPASGFRALRP